MLQVLPIMMHGTADFDYGGNVRGGDTRMCCAWRYM